MAHPREHKKSQVAAGLFDPLTIVMTEQQKTQLASLNRDIKQLIHEINKPYAMVMSAVVVPLMMQMLVLHPSSPLHEWYSAFKQYTYGNDVTKMTLEVTSQLTPELEQTLKNHDKILNNFKVLQKIYNAAHEQQVALADVAGKMDWFDEGSHYTVALRQQIISHCLNFHVFHVFATARNPMQFELDELREKLGKMDLPQLFLFMEKRFELIINKVIPSAAREIAEGHVSQEINKMMLLVKTFMFLALDYFVANRIVDRLLPNGGFFAPSSPTFNMNKRITVKDIDDHIYAQQEYKQLLEHRAKLSRNIFRALCGVFIPLAIFIFSMENVPDFWVYIGIGLMSCALANIIEDMQALYNRCRSNVTSAMTHYSFEQRRKLYAELSQDCPVNISVERGANLAQSYFVIETLSHHGLSKKALTKLLKQCLLHYKAVITFESDDVIRISANYKIEKSIVSAIAAMFLRAIERNISIKKLSSQLESVVRLFSPLLDEEGEAIIRMPLHDSDGLPTIQYEFYIPDHNRHLLDIMQVFCPELTINESEDETDLYYLLVTISGHQFINDVNGLHQALKAKIFTPYGNEAKEDFLPKQYPDSGKHKARRRKNTPDVVEGVQPQAANPERVFIFPSGTYNSTRANNRIHPLLLGKVHDKNSIANTNHFVLFALRRSDFPLGTDLFKQLKAMVDFDCPSIKRKRGGQGLVFAKGSELNQDGQRVNVSLKGRIFGEQGRGDIRIFGRKEISNDKKKNLHVVECVKFGAHSKK